MDAQQPLQADNSPAKRVTDGERASLELQHLQKEVEKLTLEVEALKASTWWDRALARYLPLVTALVALAAFWFGVIQFKVQSIAAEQERTLELKRDAGKPFWETQLALYIKASEAAATLATSDDANSRATAESTFWALYWGPLHCVEDIVLNEQPQPEVEQAMVAFGDQLKIASTNSSDLRVLALNIAGAMRNELGPSFKLSTAKSLELRTQKNPAKSRD